MLVTFFNVAGIFLYPEIWRFQDFLYIIAYTDTAFAGSRHHILK